MAAVSYKYSVVLIVVLASVLEIQAGDKIVKKLQIGVKERPEKCDMRTKKGDKLSMHYTVSDIQPKRLTCPS